MPIDTYKAQEQWNRYTYCRDTGHMLYVEKANRCGAYVRGDQWEAEDLARLRAARRPALTLNKTLITLESILGEQIDTRSEIAFKGRYGAPPENPDILTKVFRFISDTNQLNWVRSDVFCDGAITSRGYYDVRMNFDNSTTGDVAISVLNPKNVIPDPDATEYDPDKWADVMVTTWMSPDDVKLLYNAEDAEALKIRTESSWAYGFDSIDNQRDRFGGATTTGNLLTPDTRNVSRIIRVIDRQHRVMAKMKFFVNPKTGDRMQIPGAWTREHIAAVVQQTGVIVTEDFAKRIRWTVTADEYVLHDDWSPYKHFTVVPYFPFFWYGRTVGLVENLIDPQNLLNKTTSAELHVVGTSANSGWKIKSGALVNMDAEDLEEKGAQTGLVLEVNGDPDKDAVKIEPNQIPQGLDRLSMKAEQYIQSISGRGNSQLGLARADVAGKAIDENIKASDVTLRKSFDNLERTDWILARNVLDLVQEYFTDPRIMNVTHNGLAGDVDTIHVNVGDGSGKILNDLTLGTYDVVVVSSPAKRTLEESQFEQAVGLRELGIRIPDEFMIMNSNLMGKTDLVKAMRAAAESPEAQAEQKIQLLTAQLQLAELKAQTSKEEADAVLKRAKAEKEIANTLQVAKEVAGQDNEGQIKEREHQQEMEHSAQKHTQEMQQQREKHVLDQDLKKKQAEDDRIAKRAQAVVATRAAARQASQPVAKAA